MPDQATEAPVTDEELADAIRVRGRQVRNGIKVLQLILDHIPPETRRVPWNGQQDFYRNHPPTHAAPVSRAARIYENAQAPPCGCTGSGPLPN
jgi:hypothetical protein